MSTSEGLRLLQSRLLDLRKPAVYELIRITSSEIFNFMNQDHISAVGEYRSISIMGEAFFEKPFSTGKDAATVLRLAWSMGPKFVCQELSAFARSGAEYEDMFPPEDEKSSGQA